MHVLYVHKTVCMPMQHVYLLAGVCGNAFELKGDIVGFTLAPLVCYESPSNVVLTVRLTGRY